MAISNRTSSRAAPLTEPTTKTVVFRGMRGRCPNCGAGPLMSGFLRVRDHCPVCREPLRRHHLRNEPVYVTLALVALIMVPFLTTIFIRFKPDPLILFTIFAVGCVGLSLYFLPRVKGVMVAWQWSHRKFGFAARD